MSSGPRGGGTWTGVAVTIGAIALAAAIALAITPFREAIFDAVQGETASVREDLRDAGGVALVAGLAIVHVVVWYPAEILDAATGYVYGFAAGFPLVMACWIGSGLLAYVIGRNAARPVLFRILGERRFLEMERLIDRGGVTFLLAARLVPIVPFSLMGYVAGAARVPVPRFTWTTAVGYAPITAYFTYLGSRLEGFSTEDPLLWIGAGALLLALVGIRFLIPAIEDRDDARELEH